MSGGMDTPSFKSSWARPEIAVSAGCFCLSLVAGLFLQESFSGAVLDDFQQLAEQLVNLGPGGLLLIIFLNNALKALAAIILGILAGIPSLFFIIFNGFTLGVVAASLTTGHGLAFVLAALVPHGIIEVPLIILASGLGLYVGRQSLNWLIKRDGPVKASLTDGLRIYVKWIMPGLAIASVVETFVTPLIAAIVLVVPPWQA
jgi:stage II sporulation protein M